jgi:signal transduction histidine kinase
MALANGAPHTAFISLALTLTLLQALHGENAALFDGLPFTRSYALAEIGDIPRGARLSFDALGRVAVTNDSTVVVLNDATWMDVAEKNPSGEPVLQYIREISGTTYYCGQGAWGIVEYTAEGKMRPHSVVPAACPKWVSITNFSEIIPGGKGVYFSGWNGVVYWDRSTNEHLFFALPQVSHLFKVRDKVFVSSLTDGIQFIDLPSRTLRPFTLQGLAGLVVEKETELSDGRILVATAGRELLIFDGQGMVPWANQLGERAKSRVSDLIHLTDGGIAMAIEGQGVFILSEQGNILTSLASPEYHQATELVTREAGVLWIATESGVEKVLYNSPVAVVDQRLGVPIAWPQLVYWRGRTVIASNGHIYERNFDPAREVDGFQLVANQPANGVWGIAAQGGNMLVANAFGVFARAPSGDFFPVLSGINVDRLVMVNPELCYVIGATEITALRWADGRWSECVARVPGVGYPAIIHAAKASAWIELGPNRAARVAMREGKLSVRVFDSFPWTGPAWIHVSVVGNTAVLCAPPKGRIFFDEETETLVDAPQLRQLFNEAPFWISRLKLDNEGTYWASYEQGVFKIQQNGNSYRFDRTTLDLIKDRVPVVRMLEGNDIWISSGYSLYHINPKPGFELKPTAIKPRLVSVLDGRSRQEVVGAMHTADALPRLKFAQNSLTFRFFAGGYTSMRSPSYEFKMNGRPILGADSLLTLPDLREGSYHLEVKLADARGPVGESLAVDFTIDPPWYRTWFAYIFEVTAGAIAVIGLIAWALRQTRSRNLALEKLVRERTEELRNAMERLEEETRNAATLAERDRLAGEIHDSLQQGLSGLILQLDATLKLAGVTQDVRSRLNVARNMVSFTRHEVQNAVWNLESPLLENADLGDALNKMAVLISSGGPQIELKITGTPRRLSSSVLHHLLRIAQEAITNAVRHGAANRITVLLHYADDSVSLAVNDDGRGFVPQQVLTHELGHFGLRGLRGRADKINGDIKIVSEPGHGTSIRISVPSPF